MPLDQCPLGVKSGSHKLPEVLTRLHTLPPVPGRPRDLPNPGHKGAYDTTITPAALPLPWPQASPSLPPHWASYNTPHGAVHQAVASRSFLPMTPLPPSSQEMHVYSCSENQSNVARMALGRPLAGSSEPSGALRQGPSGLGPGSSFSRWTSQRSSLESLIFHLVACSPADIVPTTSWSSRFHWALLFPILLSQAFYPGLKLWRVALCRLPTGPLSTRRVCLNARGRKPGSREFSAGGCWEDESLPQRGPVLRPALATSGERGPGSEAQGQEFCPCSYFFIPWTPHGDFYHERITGKKLPGPPKSHLSPHPHLPEYTLYQTSPKQVTSTSPSGHPGGRPGT